MDATWEAGTTIANRYFVSVSLEMVKKAIAKVVCSYFSPYSLKNRSAFSNPFESMPLCSVLVMEQIKEDELSQVASGVMMTHKTAWGPRREGPLTHIVSSFGKGSIDYGRALYNRINYWL